MNDHYYTEKPESSIRTKEIRYNDLVFITSSGVFGKNKPDKGTILLIENCRPGKKVLDLGCGYGIIGISLKKKYPSVEITCSDINKRAVNLAKQNSEKNNTSLTLLQSDIFDNIKENFDTILINLPQKAGKEICFKMISESFKHLKSKGTLQIVSRHQKGGKQYEKKMIEIFENCIYLAKGSGYRVYLSKKST